MNRNALGSRRGRTAARMRRKTYGTLTILGGLVLLIVSTIALTAALEVYQLEPWIWGFGVISALCGVGVIGCGVYLLANASR